MRWWIPFIVIACALCEDRLSEFYERIKRPDAKYCMDKSKLLPDCDKCIPGLKPGATNSDACVGYVPESADIRNEILKLTQERYADKLDPRRPYGLYPYLERPDFMIRQITFGKMLSLAAHAEHILDIGAYYNPVHLFLDASSCPKSVIVVEPILDALSVILPCQNDPTSSTHIIFLPITFKYYVTVKPQLPASNTVVCIGCDSHYGPNRRMLETSFEKPYILYLEYPSEYVHNVPFRKMSGAGAGEKMTYHHKFQPNTTETMYTKRVMKVIEYAAL